MAQRALDRTELNLGIDFGTSFTRVTYFDPITRETRLLRFRPQEQGFRQFAIPSLAVRSGGRWLFGYEAERNLREAHSEPTPTPVRSLKRQLSKPDPEGKVLTIDGETFEVTSVIAEFLKYVLKVAEPVLQAQYARAKIDAVPMNLSVPVLFDDRARRKILDVYTQVFGDAAKGKLIVNEPTAAGMAEYRSPSGFPAGGTAVFDAGAGTTDVTILNRVGDHLLVVESDAEGVGGDDLDKALATVVEAGFRARGIDLSDPLLEKLWRIERSKVTRLKERLSAEDDVEEVFTLGTHQMPFRYSSTELEQRVGPIAKRMAAVLSRALDRARRQFERTSKPFKLTEVLVVGGTSYTPVLRRHLEKAVQTWIAETRQVYGNPVIRHIMNLPGASQDGALFAVALGTAYPAQNFQEIRLGRVPYDVELRLGNERTRVIKLLDAYGQLPATPEKVTASTEDFYPYTAEIRFLQAGIVRQTVPINFELRSDPNLRVQVVVRIELSANATLDVSYGTIIQRMLTQIRQTMPWQDLLARKVEVLGKFYYGTDKYAKHGDFRSEGHGDASPG